MILHIIKPNGAHYKVNAQGEISRQHWNGNDTFMPYSPQWKLQGITHVKRREYYPLEKITPELLESLDILYKNGNPQYTVRDLDYGTTREWGNTHYHGIKHIYFDKE